MNNVKANMFLCFLFPYMEHVLDYFKTFAECWFMRYLTERFSVLRTYYLRFRRFTYCEVDTFGTWFVSHLMFPSISVWLLCYLKLLSAVSVLCICWLLL